MSGDAYGKNRHSSTRGPSRQSNGEVTVSRAKDGRFTKGSRRPANAGRKKGTPNRATRAWKDFVGELVNRPGESGPACSRHRRTSRAALQGRRARCRQAEADAGSGFKCVVDLGAASKGRRAARGSGRCACLASRFTHPRRQRGRAPLPPLPRELGGQSGRQERVPTVRASCRREEHLGAGRAAHPKLDAQASGLLRARICSVGRKPPKAATRCLG
jgi:hypothetical protein